jgi:hypothetical protein
MHRSRAVVLAALAAALPILASDLHGWLLAGLALTTGVVALLAFPLKKPCRCHALSYVQYTPSNQLT